MIFRYEAFEHNPGTTNFWKSECERFGIIEYKHGGRKKAGFIGYFRCVGLAITGSCVSLNEAKEELKNWIDCNNIHQ